MTTTQDSSDMERYRLKAAARNRARVLIRYFGGARHFASITGVTYQTVYNYMNGFYTLGQQRKEALLAYSKKVGIDFDEADFEDTSRIEAIMTRGFDVQCVLCLDEPCKYPVDYRKVPWLMGRVHE